MQPKRPDGPRLNLAIALIAQMLPRYFPYDSLAFGLKLAQDFGDIAFTQFGPLRVYYLNHPDLVRQILIDQSPKFHKPRLMKSALRMLGEGLIVSDGLLWKQQRKLMQPAFSQQRLAVYGEIMVAQAQRTVESFSAGDVRDIGADMMQLTMNIVVKCLFGSDLPVEPAEIRHVLQTVLDGANQRMNSAFQFLPSWIPTPGNLREGRALAKIDAVLADLTRARRGPADSRDDLLSVLLAAADDEGGARMSDRQLRDELMTLFLAGHDTTANALTWAWYLLSRHAEVEATLHEELQRTLGGRTPAVADLAHLPYLESVVRESLRLYPPVALFGREPKEDVEIAGYTVRKGSLVVVNTYAIHRDPRFFSNPERFDPNRFSSGWDERIPRFAYLPFGAGPRVCIGNGFAMMEARLILATMAQRYRLILETRDEIKPVQLVTVRPNVPVRMRCATHKAPTEP